MSQPNKLDLIRGLGPWAAMAMVVGHIIGTGVFLVPHRMAEATHSVGLIFLAWVLGGALSLAGALTVAELGASMPQAGGPYVYLSRGLGPRWGFLFGWMNNLVGKPTSIATIAAGFLIFLGDLLPGVRTPIFTWHIPLPGSAEPYEFVFTYAQPLAAVAILFLTFINYLGVRLAGRLQVTLTVVKIGSILALVGFGFLLGQRDTTSTAPLFPQAINLDLMKGFFIAMVGAMWAYDGWVDLTFAGSEVEAPHKNIPRAVVGGTIIVGTMYLLANAVYFYVLPVERVASPEVPNAAYESVRVFAGADAAILIVIAMVISGFTTLNSSILTGARVPFAMARDGLFFRVADGIHPRYRTPSGALVFQGVMASLMVLTGRFDELFSLFIFAQWIFYALTIASVIGLRRREPGLDRPYRAWGYPVLPLLFIIGAAALTVSIYIDKPWRSSAGLLLILSGLFFYRKWRTAATSHR